MSAITWRRALGLRSEEAAAGATVYEGTTAYGIEYRVVSEPRYGTVRTVRAYRVVQGGRLHPAAEGGELRMVAEAKAQAEADLGAVLRDRGIRILQRAYPAPIERLYCTIGQTKPVRHGYTAWEGHDYFPTDVPFVDLFVLEIDRDGEAQLVCPCGEAVAPAYTLGEISDQARELAAKHGKA